MPLRFSFSSHSVDLKWRVASRINIKFVFYVFFLFPSPGVRMETKNEKPYGTHEQNGTFCVLLRFALNQMESYNIRMCAAPFFSFCILAPLLSFSINTVVAFHLNWIFSSFCHFAKSVCLLGTLNTIRIIENECSERYTQCMFNMCIYSRFSSGNKL